MIELNCKAILKNNLIELKKQLAKKLIFSWKSNWQENELKLKINWYEVEFELKSN